MFKLLKIFNNKEDPDKPKTLLDVIKDNQVSIISLENSKKYMLVVPSTISIDELEDIAEFLNQANVTFMLVQAENVKIIEFA